MFPSLWNNVAIEGVKRKQPGTVFKHIGVSTLSPAGGRHIREPSSGAVLSEFSNYDCAYFINLVVSIIYFCYLYKPLNHLFILWVVVENEITKIKQHKEITLVSLRTIPTGHTCTGSVIPRSLILFLVCLFIDLSMIF